MGPDIKTQELVLAMNKWLDLSDLAQSIIYFSDVYNVKVQLEIKATIFNDSPVLLCTRDSFDVTSKRKLIPLVYDLEVNNPIILSEQIQEVLTKWKQLKTEYLAPTVPVDVTLTA